MRLDIDIDTEGKRHAGYDYYNSVINSVFNVLTTINLLLPRSVCVCVCVCTLESYSALSKKEILLFLTTWRNP